METISVILPIYNAAAYLEKCLDSLLSQRHTKLEIILVNDGSKDQSLEICQAYAAKDSRFVVIDKVNEGVAIARNVGLEAATGEYVAFVDPDDWVEPEMYQSLLAHIKRWDATVCLCNFYKDTKRRSVPKCFEFQAEQLVGEEITQWLINDMIGVPDLLPKYAMVMGSVWRGLYKRSFLEEQKLRFVPKLTIMEDLVFMVRVLLKCERVAIDQGIWYHYVQHASSALHTYNGQLWEDQLVVYQQLEEILKEAHLEEKMRNRLDIRYIGMVLTAIKNETYMHKDGDFKDTIIRIKEIFNDDRLKDVLERVKPIQVEKSQDKMEKVRQQSSHQIALNKTSHLKEEKKVHHIKEKTKDSLKRKRKTHSTSLYKESKDRYNE